MTVTHPYLTAREATAALGVSPATLYAYVSRGMLRSEADPAGGRGRRYPREDVERLLARKAARRSPEEAAGEALDFGLPVIDSAITAIADGHLFYRGHDALELARERSFEEVAMLLWTGELRPMPDDRSPLEAMIWQDVPGMDGLGRCQAFLPLAAAADPAAWDLRPATAPATAARLVRLVAVGLAGGPESPESDGTLAGTLTAGWGVDGDDEAKGRTAIETALVLSADHELNVSAFTARCVTSAGSSPYDAVAAALAALKGHRHGGMAARVEALVREAEARSARRTVEERLRRGETIPGFGHTLYPAGDPRGPALLEAARSVVVGAEASAAVETAIETIDALVDAVGELLGEHPTLDLGLVALTRALDLPEGSPLALFAAGRTAGWLAHVIEESERGRLIRPRARYVGRPPRAGAQESSP